MVDVGELEQRFRNRTATVGIVGLGYVGLPLAHAILGAGVHVVGLDVDQAKIDMLLGGRSYIRHLPAELFDAAIAEGRFAPTADFARSAACDAILICVPTPLTRHREPDLSYVTGTAEALLPHLRAGQLIVLESTTYPGTTRELLKPVLERLGAVSGRDFFLAFSPEREDPGNPKFSTTGIPKVVGGDGPDALRLAVALYDQFVASTVPVSSTDTAEAVKITENIFRAVNIALVNELKLIYGAMGVDVWEVIEAAKTKPFGYMPFYPGPGLGGHCIPVDPFYLTWKAREHDLPTRFIELAGEINAAMPDVVVTRIAREFNARFGRGLKNARVLLMGMAYKKNVDDIRESPCLRLMEHLEDRGARVDFHDPFIPLTPRTREYPQFADRASVPLRAETVATYDLALIATDHDDVDYALLVEHCPLVVDTRNVLHRKGLAGRDNVCKA